MEVKVKAKAKKLFSKIKLNKTNYFVLLLFINMNLFAWTSSNTGLLYEMDDLCVLSDSISYNSSSSLYDITCDIIIKENDTLKLNAGEIIKFYSTGIDIYGTMKALGEFDNKIIIGDPEHSMDTWGERVDGIHFRQTSQMGESVLQHCIINGVQRYPGFGGIICEDSSPIIDHCDIKNIPMDLIETGGVIGLICTGESYPLIKNCNFFNIQRGIALKCSFSNAGQDTLNYPSPLMFNCNVYFSVTSYYMYPVDYDIVVLYGGFLDNCYLQGDMSLGAPQDLTGDGICTTNSTSGVPSFWLVDGVWNPSYVPVSSINNENDILPTTSKSLILYKNYPNPFNPRTTIDYSIINNNLRVNLFIYNCKGSLVKKIFEDKTHKSGNYSVDWNGRNSFDKEVNSGIYFLKLFSGEEVIVKQAILVK